MRRNAAQLFLFTDPSWNGLRHYGKHITATVNRKGVLDVDTVKGCELGMRAHPGRGCYGDCYAYQIAAYRGFDFAVSVNRGFCDREHVATVRNLLNYNESTWYRVGTHGDPSHDWAHTLSVLKYLWPTEKTPVVITKHWRTLDDAQVDYLRKLKAVVNTSVSALDSDAELEHRLTQLHRLRDRGVTSVCRVITCSFGATEWAQARSRVQSELLSLAPVIDNPFRPTKTNPLVTRGDVLVETRADSIGGNVVSLHAEGVHLGHCRDCDDQCGVAAQAA